MKLSVSILALMLFVQSIIAQDVFTAFLIGDAGNTLQPNKTLLSLKRQLDTTPNSIVFFLGDNIYPHGLDGSIEAEQKLQSQLGILKDYRGEWIFVPGNHDWKAGLWKGYECVIRQQNFIAQVAKDSFADKKYRFNHFYPTGGLPGPVNIDVGNASFIITDTDWWLQRQFFHKVGKTGSYKNMEAQYLHRLDSLLTHAEQFKKIPLFLSHHPLLTYGFHSKSREPWRFLNNYTPLQLLGLCGGNRALLSDIKQPRYRRMANKLLAVLQKHTPYICVAGHEHNLQHIVQDNAAYVISGAGSKLTGIPEKSKGIAALHFGKEVPGFAVLRFQKNMPPKLIVFDENGVEMYSAENVWR